MEMLSREFSSNNSTANLVVQTPASAAAGFDAKGTANFDTPGLPFDPSAAYHEYRFDWMPGQVNFYIDGTLYDIMTTEIPNSPGKVVLNHWSNGDPNWSGGPPQSDAIMTVMYVKAYFNSTNTHPDYAKACPKYDASKVCRIPDQTSAPVLGNDSPTFFFFAQGNETNGQTTSNSTWNSHGQHNAASTSFGSASVLMATLFAAASIWLLGFSS
jgi:beta-glucanase (GH16 family)